MSEIVAVLLALTLGACDVRPEPEYYLPCGIGVVVGEKNKPPPLLIEQWALETLLFWAGGQCTRDLYRLLLIQFVDDLEVKPNIIGLAKLDKLWAVVGHGDPRTVQGTTIHELSHFILYYCKLIPSEWHHSYFDANNLSIIQDDWEDIELR